MDLRVKIVKISVLKIISRPKAIQINIPVDFCFRYDKVIHIYKCKGLKIVKAIRKEEQYYRTHLRIIINLC